MSPGRRAAAWTAVVVTLAGPALGFGPVLAQAPAPSPAAPASPPALPASYVCTGNEPFWKLEVTDATASFSQPGATGEVARQFKGRSAPAPWARVPFLVWRGRTDAGLRELVAVITQEGCQDTMSEEGPTGGRFPFTARLSTPQGEVRTGCCRPAGADAGWAPVERPEPLGRITGTATYLARVALTPQAVLRVGLYDTAQTDAEPVSEVVIRRPGQVPIPFELPYLTARINPKRTYTVRATIVDGDRPVMATTRPYRVITDGQPTRVELMLGPVKPSTP